MSRTISLPIHAALELVLGLALLAGSFAFGLEPAGLVAAFSLGVVIVGLALAGPDSLPVSAHQSFDLALVAALGGGGLGLAVSGDLAADMRRVRRLRAMLAQATPTLSAGRAGSR